MRIDFTILSNVFSTIDKYIPPAITRVALAALAVFGSAYAYYSWQKRKFEAQMLSERNLEGAVRCGDLAVVQQLMKGNANLIAFVKGDDGRSPFILTTAVDSQKFDVADYLLQQGAHIDEVTRAGTPLQWAIQKGNLEGVRWCLKHKANPNPTDCSHPPLYHAIVDKHDNKYEIIELLVNNNASLEFKDLIHSPLFFMGMLNDSPERTKIIQLMLSKGAKLRDEEINTDSGKQIEAMRKFS